MSGSLRSMALQCHICDHRWPESSVVEAMLLHFQVEHDTDAVTVDLRAICECGAAMDFTHTETERPRPNRTVKRDHFRCVCGKRGAIRRYV